MTAVLLEAFGKVFPAEVWTRRRRSATSWATVTLVEMKNKVQRGELLQRKSLQAQ